MSKHPSEPNDPDARRVTLRDIAKEIGVSHVTVSKALRNKPGPSAELRERIQKKADEMGYAPDPMLTALAHYRKTSKTKPIQAELAWINTWSPEGGVRSQESRLTELCWRAGSGLKNQD